MVESLLRWLYAGTGNWRLGDYIMLIYFLIVMAVVLFEMFKEYARKIVKDDGFGY